MKGCYFGTPSGACAGYDFNGDGYINIQDLACLKRWHKTFCGQDAGPLRIPRIAITQSAPS